MNTIYFLNETGAVKIRPTSMSDKIMWTKWYQAQGLKEVTKKEYDIAKKIFKKNKNAKF